jgi:hypothetical protein
MEHCWEIDESWLQKVDAARPVAEEAVVGNCPENEIYDESERVEPVSLIIHSVLSTHANKKVQTQISAGSFHWRAYLRAGRRNMSGS